MRQYLKYQLHNFVYWFMCHWPENRLTYWMESRLRDDEGDPMLPWRCQDCGRVYGNDGWIDCIIPDEQWVAIGMPADGGGLLCGACTIVRLEKLPGVTHVRMEARAD